MINHKGSCIRRIKSWETEAMPGLKLLASYLLVTELLYVLSPFFFFFLLNRINVTQINFISLKLASQCDFSLQSKIYFPMELNFLRNLFLFARGSEGMRTSRNKCYLIYSWSRFECLFIMRNKPLKYGTAILEQLFPQTESEQGTQGL